MQVNLHPMQAKTDASTSDPKDLGACPLCGCRAMESRGKRSDFALLDGYAPYVSDLRRFDRQVLACRTCGLSMIRPMYGDAELAELYGTAAYARFQQGGDSAEDLRSPQGRKLLECWTNQFRALKLDAFCAATISSRGRATFLDVGCGAGRNMLVFQGLGFETTGIELNATEASQARALTGSRVVDASAEHFSRSGEQFDCLLASHVLEHVTDPVAFLEALDRLLAPEGLLVLETPLAQDSGSFEGRFRDIYHTHFFDHFTLVLLAQRTGFTIRAWNNIVFDDGRSSRNWLLQAVLARGPAKTAMSEGAIAQMRSAYDALLPDALSWSSAFLSQSSSAQMRKPLAASGRRLLRALSWRRLKWRFGHRG